MKTLEVHPEIHVQEQHQRPEFATCRECYGSFRPKSEDQFWLQLCNRCFESVQHACEKVVSVRVKVLPNKAVFLCAENHAAIPNAPLRLIRISCSEIRK